MSVQPSLTAARDKSGKTALHYCAENLTVGCAELLLMVEPGLASVQDEEGYTTLHFAVISGNRTMVRFLVDRGADVSVLDNEKHSCVHWATVCGELECMDILVAAGADPSTPDIHGAYPIHYAAQMCGPNSEMGNDVRVGLAALRRLIQLGVDVSVRDQDGRPPLLWAASVETRPSKTYCSSGSSDAILALVNAGADVSATDKDGLTALHCAASRGHVDCLETLISLCGAEVDAVDSNGCSALFYAVTLGHADCTQLLLKYGAMANRQDHKGRTPAHCGAAKGQSETLKILAQHGANLYMRNLRGDLPLHEAVQSGRKAKGQSETLKILAQHGANLYMRNLRGDLPLHEAVQSGRKDLVQWLLELQPSAVNSPNNNGRSALHVAAIANSVEMCKVLMDKGAEVNPVMRNNKGQLMTPLDASLQRGNRGCAKYLRLHGALPFCKMTDRHDIDRWLEHSFNINKLHQTEQLCDGEAPPPHHVLQLEEHMVETSRHVKTLETSVQTDSGYFESRDFLTGNAGLLTEANVAAITKQGTIVEGGRTLKQAIITNVYVRTSGATRTHQSKRRGKQADEKGPRHDNEDSGSCNSSSADEQKDHKKITRRHKGREVEAEDGLITKTSRKQVLSDSKGHNVSEEVIIKRKEGKEGQVVKRIIRKPSGSDEEVWVSGELEDNMETTPEGFTSVSFSERKSNEALHASSGEELKKTTSRSTERLRAEKQDSGRQPAVSPVVARAAELPDQAAQTADASCSPGTPVLKEVETKDAGCSPPAEAASPERADVASSPIGATDKVDDGCSPIKTAVDQTDQASSPPADFYKRDAGNSPHHVEVGDKDAATSPPTDLTCDASSTPLSPHWQKVRDSIGVLDVASSPIKQTEMQDTASSPTSKQWTQDSKCSPIPLDFAKETRSVACSPPDLNFRVQPSDGEYSSVAVSPIKPSVFDKASSPPETVTTNDALSSPVLWSPKVEKGSSPHKAYMKDSSCSPIPEANEGLSQGDGITADVRSPPLDTATAEAVNVARMRFKALVKDASSGTTPVKEVLRAKVVEASCSPIGFEYQQLSRSSTDSIDVEIPARSSSIEEAEKSPQTDIGAIPAFAEVATSPIENGTYPTADSVGVLAKPLITDIGTSPLGPASKTVGTSTESKPEPALSDISTSPVEYTRDSTEKPVTKDASNSPISVPASSALALDGRKMKHVQPNKKHLRKSRSWDVIGFGGPIESLAREIQLPEINGVARGVPKKSSATTNVSPVQNGSRDSLEKTTLEETSHLQKLPAIVKTASTPPDTTATSDARSNVDSPGALAARKKASLHPIGSKRHSLSQSDLDRSPESSIRSSDHTVTLKDSGFSDVERPHSGSSGEEDRTDHAVSDSAAQQLELQRRKLLLRRKNSKVDASDDTDGSGAEDATRLDLSGIRHKGDTGRSEATGVKRERNGRAESVREQRKRRVPNLRPVSENYKSPEDMTLAVQESIRKYRLERQLFNELQELKRHQIRSGRTHENVLVKRLVDRYRELVLGPGMRDFGGPYTFRNYEMYLYGQLRDLSNSNDGKVPAKYKKKEGEREERRGSDNALECASESYKRRHAVEARALAPGSEQDPDSHRHRQQAEMGASVPQSSETQMRPVYQHPASKKNLLPAILPSPLTSVFTVVRGAPNIPTTRSTNYSHIKSRVFPQRPAERVKLTEAEEDPSSKPLKQRFRSKDASTSTAGVSSNQASRLRVERIKKQREEETQRKKVEKSMKTVSVSEQRQVKHSSVIDLKKISEEDFEYKVSFELGGSEELESMEKKERSRSTTREETKQSYQETPTRRSKATPKREAGKGATPSKSTASNQKPEQTSYRSPEASSQTAEAKSTFPFLKKHEGRLSVPKPHDDSKPKLSTATKSHKITTSESTGAKSQSVLTQSVQISSTEPKIEDAKETPRRRFSKARNAAPKKSSALLPFWVPHDPSRVDTSKEDSSSARQKSSVRESLGEQAVRFKDWIKSRKSSKTGRRSAATRTASRISADATEELAREVQLRDGDSSETDSGHEGDGILPDERVKDALLEKVSRSLRKSVLPHDVVTMQLKPSPVVTTDDDVEAITRTVRMSEFLEAAQRDIVVNCVQLKPDNVSETGSSPDVVSNASDSPSSSGDSSDDGIIEFEIRHGREKNVFWLPTSKMRDNKKWQVTFIVAKAGSSKE
ncbi:uncharacterized protein ISCGN_030067 [Ixodes scapularis]